MFSHDIKCISYSPGHCVHWIQAMHARDSQTASDQVSLVHRRGSQVEVLVNGQAESWRFHATHVTRQYLDAWEGGEHAQLRPHGLLLLDGGGRLYPCRDPQAWTECRWVLAPRIEGMGSLSNG